MSKKRSAKPEWIIERSANPKYQEDLGLSRVEMTPDMVVGLIVQKTTGGQTVDGKVVFADHVKEFGLESGPILMGLAEFEDGTKGFMWINKPGFGCWRGRGSAE